MRRNGFWSAKKVLVDNSSAVEGFGVEAKSVYDQKEAGIIR
jgi:hypothetical protein